MAWFKTQDGHDLYAKPGGALEGIYRARGYEEGTETAPAKAASKPRKSRKAKPKEAHGERAARDHGGPDGVDQPHPDPAVDAGTGTATGPGV